jgi:hypothetical protein
MSKVYGAEKIRRTCLVKGREGEGRFGLLRKQLNVSKVLASGQEGEGEDVATDLVYDERIMPRPARTPNKPTTETKTYPADKPLRRVCFVNGQGEQKFHLLRKGVELSKVLAVGEEGQGHWINTGDIRDEHMVPIPTKTRIVERKPVRLCKLSTTGDQEYLVLRKTDKGAKLLPVYDGNYGILVSDLSQIVDEHIINQAKKGKKAKKDDTADQAASDNGEQHASETVGEVQAPVQPAPPVQPVAPVAAQPQRVIPTQPQRPVPTQPQGAPRPAPVGAGAAPRAPQGRPVGQR